MAVVFVSMVGSVPNSATGIELWLPPKVTKATVAVLAPVTCRFICSGTCRKLGLAQYDATCSHGQAAAISLAMFQVYIILKASEAEAVYVTDSNLLLGIIGYPCKNYWKHVILYQYII